MKTKKKLLFVVMATALVGLSSCKREVFDPDTYKDLMKQESPVSHIDSSQTWQMSQRYTFNVEVNALGVDAKQLLILAPNKAPNSYEVLSQVYVKNGQSATVHYAAPVIIEQLYAAVYDGQYYTLQPFTAGQSSVDFSNVSPDLSELSISLTAQGYTYCYEDGMPEPDDYDYNDLVLRIVKERTGERELKLNVTLTAIGSLHPMGAAIHLAGVQFSDIESVTTLGSRYHFVGGYPLDPLYLENADTLQEAKNGEALIALFEDAQWALDGFNLPNDYTIISQRYTYNTVRTQNETTLQRSPRTVTYTVTFKSEGVLDRLTMDDIDPFMIKDYNGGIWEVHIPPYQTAQLLWEYQQPEDMKILPWAIAVPTSTFRYPLEGKCLGKYRNGVISGAYMDIGHSFGQWATDKEIAKDWYLYPSANQVY